MLRIRGDLYMGRGFTDTYDDDDEDDEEDVEEEKRPSTSASSSLLEQILTTQQSGNGNENVLDRLRQKLGCFPLTPPSSVHSEASTSKNDVDVDDYAPLDLSNKVKVEMYEDEDDEDGFNFDATRRRVSDTSSSNSSSAAELAKFLNKPNEEDMERIAVNALLALASKGRKAA